MLSTVNDRSLSTNSYYIGFCAPALCLCSSLLLGNRQRQHRHHHRQQGTRQRRHQGTGTAGQAAGHRRGADRAATTSRRPSAHSRIMVIMPTPSAAGRPADATGSPGGGSSDGQESTAGRRRSGRHSPPFSGGERFSVRYRALATLPPQSFIGQHPYHATSTHTPPNKKADPAHSPHLRFRYSAHTLLRSLTLRSYACRPNTICKPHISPCFPFYGNEP